MNTQIKNKKGFTIVEALVAISLVLVGVTTVFATAQAGLSNTSAVRNRVTAMFLAQEAQEAVKNLKDSNLHKIATGNYPNLSWLNGIVDGPTDCERKEACGYDIMENENYDTRMLRACAALDGCEVKLDNGFYRQTTSGTDTGFIRTIYVDETVDNNEATVRVTITRPNDPRFETFEVNNVMYGWFQRGQ